ncbi:MAG: hypothetical protein FWG70_00235 [Oscillospiraceae bacterium]|nr:hypothetical protein [Oscillospiraceae bacterium]
MLNILPIQINGQNQIVLAPAANQDVTESADYKQIKFTNGYGSLSKAGCQVQLGVTGKVTIDLKITSLSERFYKEVTDKIVNEVKNETASELEERYKKTDKRDWWFSFFSGGSKDETSSETYKNSKSSSVDIASTTVFNAVKENLDRNLQEFSVKGTFKITGTSMIPTSVFLYIELLTITMSDGTQFLVPSEQTKIADDKGKQASAECEGEITITPLF